MLRLLTYIIPLFLTLHLSVARYRANYDQLPLSSLPDDVPRNNLPEGDMAANDEAESACEDRIKIPCSGSFFTVVKCRDYSLTSCHVSIPKYGYRRCKPLEIVYITQCEGAYPTKCGCAKI
ncbi:hypothetical protein ACROYT_G036827 [Oculina patagonica]